jgi:DNA-binding FadR family transcriptional regulator
MKQTPRGAAERDRPIAEEDDPPSAEALELRLLEIAAGGREIPPERTLAADWQVPRSRLRRALAALRDSGQLPPAQVGRRAVGDGGPRVEDLVRLANPTDVIELRILLEPQLARLAAIRASANDTAQISRAAAGRLGDSYGAADLAFHREVARASRNVLAKELYDLIRQVGTDSRVRLPQRTPLCPNRRRARDREHMAIARAIAERDPDRAAAAMQAHLAEVQRLIVERMSPVLLDAGSAAG